MITNLQGDSIYVCSCWELLKRSGGVLRITDLDRVIKVGDDTYYPSTPTASAFDRQASLKDRQREVKGVITSDLLREDELTSGEYDDAPVWCHLVDWDSGTIMRSDAYWVDQVTWDEAVFNISLVQLSSWAQREIGVTLDRTCRFRLYGVNCGVDRSTYTRSFVVSSVEMARRVFTVTGTFVTDMPYTDAEYLWNTGANTGLRGEITKRTGQQLQLWLPTPGIVAVGDQLNVWPGCDGALSTCRDKFNNVQRFGGFPFTPGINRAIKTPDSK